MKRIIASVFILTIMSCNSGDPIEQNVAENLPPKMETASSPEQPSAAAQDLPNGVPQLNDGKKWQADASTNENVEALQATIKRFKSNANPEVEDYHAFQASFTDGLNKMVKECRMQGPDHDALHVWLEPLMSDNKEMKETDSKEKLAQLFNTMEKRVAIYPSYFE